MIKKWLGNLIFPHTIKIWERISVLEAKISVLENKPTSFKDLRTKHIKCEKVSFTCHRDANGRFAKKG